MGACAGDVGEVRCSELYFHRKRFPCTPTRPAPLALCTTIMNYIRSLTGSTPTADAGPKRTREGSPQLAAAKKPHQVRPHLDLDTIHIALAMSTVLGLGRFPTLRTVSTTVTNREGFPKPAPRLTRSAPHSPAPDYNPTGNRRPR